MATLEQRIYDGSKARDVLENDVFQAVWADLEKDLIESWKNIPSSPKHADDREKLHLSVILLGKIKACIESTMESGKLAQIDLEHKKSWAQRVGMTSLLR
jgi:hypothetical protein